MAEADEGGQRFIPLADYQAPSLPGEEWFRRLIDRAKTLLGAPAPAAAERRLHPPTKATLDFVAAPPACGPLCAELDRTIAAWLADTPALSTSKLVVLPPGDEESLLAAWATQAGHQILPSPPRATLVALPRAAPPDLDGETLLVIPRLEEWFLRHRNGLAAVRALLGAVTQSRRPIVIGCNSWAWSFLCKAVSADQLLLDAVTFAPFDEIRLQHWLAPMASPMRVQRATDGSDVLAADADGGLVDDFFRTLASRSHGIPWVAWHLWRRSLRADDDDAATLFVVVPEEFSLPSKHEQTALLVLHALLIHGTLDIASLRLVLPIVGESNILASLVASGLVERQDGRFAVAPVAYPSIRSALAQAGLPLDGF